MLRPVASHMARHDLMRGVVAVAAAQGGGSES